MLRNTHIQKVSQHRNRLTSLLLLPFSAGHAVCCSTPKLNSSREESPLLGNMCHTQQSCFLLKEHLFPMEEGRRLIRRVKRFRVEKEGYRELGYSPLARKQSNKGKHVVAASHCYTSLKYCFHSSRNCVCLIFSSQTTWFDNCFYRHKLGYE